MPAASDFFDALADAIAERVIARLQEHPAPPAPPQPPPPAQYVTTKQAAAFLGLRRRLRAAASRLSTES